MTDWNSANRHFVEDFVRASEISSAYRCFGPVAVSVVECPESCNNNIILVDYTRLECHYTRPALFGLPVTVVLSSIEQRLT